mmetsp:Transcript_22530/g.47475  ORF Transcript_22530/g.47475 Transcript_22530/m.47475 type:complete len:240 (-) Transcript_22530:730-1449(-)
MQQTRQRKEMSLPKQSRRPIGQKRRLDAPPLLLRTLPRRRNNNGIRTTRPRHGRPRRGGQTPQDLSLLPHPLPPPGRRAPLRAVQLPLRSRRPRDDPRRGRLCERRADFRRGPQPRGVCVRELVVRPRRGRPRGVRGRGAEGADVPRAPPRDGHVGGRRRRAPGQHADAQIAAASVRNVPGRGSRRELVEEDAAVAGGGGEPSRGVHLRRVQVRRGNRAGEFAVVRGYGEEGHGRDYGI